MSGWAARTAGDAGHGAGVADGLAAALSLLVDELAHGVVFASPQGRVLHANQAARRLLAQQQAIAVHQGQLQASDPTQSRELLHALNLGGQGRRSLVSLSAAGEAGLSIAVLPLRGDGQPKPAMVALVLSRGDLCGSLMLCFFARIHRLTNSEEQVLAILCQGYSAPEAAQQLQVAVSTVRSHVRSLCTKTQTNGVRALVGRVAVLPPLGHSTGQQLH